MILKEFKVQGHDEFSGEFNKSWTDSNNVFSNPRVRAVSCSATILFLIQLQRINDAKDLFNECQKRKAWDPKVGIDNDLMLGFKTKETIAAICNNAFKDATDALKKIDIIYSFKQLNI